MMANHRRLISSLGFATISVFAASTVCAGTPAITVSPSAPTATSTVTFTIDTGESCAPMAVTDGITVTRSGYGTLIDVLLLTTCPEIVGVPPPNYTFSEYLGVLPPGFYTIQYRSSFRTASTPYRPAVVAATLMFAVPGDVFAPLFVRTRNDKYDELVDRATTFIELDGNQTAMDCSNPPMVHQVGNSFHITTSLLEPGGTATSCPYNRREVSLGTLASGDYVVEFNIDAKDGHSVATVEREFHVRPYDRACNRYPNSGSVLNVFSSTLNGAGIATLLTENPSLAAALGNPVVSLTLYNNVGAQFVYPTPVDPLPMRDRAAASGHFVGVGAVRGRYCGFATPPGDAESTVIEYRNAELDAFFYATDAGEIASLDVGSSWKRTGGQFRVITGPCTERQELYSAYRFFGRPGIGPTSHVFTIDQEECHAVNQSGAWIFESAAFYAERPLLNGSCEIGTHRPLYRIWRPFGESRHRFTTELAVVVEQTAKGWVEEGAVMCVVN